MSVHTHDPSTDVERAAKLAVKEVFFILGVDVSDPKSVEEFRADLRFGKNLRRVANRGLMSAVGVFTVACCYALYHGIVAAMKR